MRVRPIDPGSRRDVRGFVDLPYRLHAGSSAWVPPLRLEQRAELSRRRNPFFAHSDAGFFVAETGGEIIGRIAALDHHPYRDHTGYPGALIGSFECIDDPATASALFEEAAAWASDRGLAGLSGPRRFLIGGATGVLVDGFDHTPAPAMPWNPPHYAGLFEQHGFEKETDLLSAYVPTGQPPPEHLLAAADQVAAEAGLATWAYPSRWAMWRDRMTVAGLFNRAFTEMYDFCPLSEAEMRRLGWQMAAAADKRLVRYVRKGDEIIAFVVMTPDISPALQRAKGRLLPFGWWHLLRGASNATRASIQLFGVLPAYRGTGANLVLYAEMARRSAVSLFGEAEVVFVDESNERMLRNIEMLGGVTWAKRHRVYRLAA